MATWKVTKIVDGDTFKVTPNWTWNEQSGDTVRPVGYDAPEVGTPGGREATMKLGVLLRGQQVSLVKCVDIDRGRLVCTVLIDGEDLAEKFPEYKT